jgi:hypothetical protein
MKMLLVDREVIWRMANLAATAGWLTAGDRAKRKRRLPVGIRRTEIADDCMIVHA